MNLTNFMGRPIQIIQSPIQTRPIKVNRWLERQFQIPIEPGAPDTHTIIAYLDDFIVQFGQMPAIRSWAVRILGDAGNHDQNEQITRLARFVADRVRFVLDPVDSEFIISPLRMLRDIQAQGFTAGDCDDHVLLLGSLASALGIRSRAVGVFISPHSKRFDHVVNLFDIGGESILFDACRKSSNPAVTGYYDRFLVSK